MEILMNGKYEVELYTDTEPTLGYIVLIKQKLRSEDI
jgi:hypothetical protein